MGRKGKTFVIGDIHGANKALTDLLHIINLDTKKDKVIFLGDYVDGWSESSEVIETLIDLKKQMGDRAIFLRGNHDKWCEDWLTNGIRHTYWIPNGGESTIDSYKRTGLMIPSSGHHMFFYKLHNYYIDEENRAFVHGGFVSKKGVGHDTYPSDYHWDRDMWQLAVLLHGREDEGNNKALRFKKHKEVFIGHTSTTNWKCKPRYPEYLDHRQEKKSGPITIPMNRCNVWNLDTGAGWEGKLTAMDIDTKEFWQTDYVKNYYTNEKGRK